MINESRRWPDWSEEKLREMAAAEDGCMVGVGSADAVMEQIFGKPQEETFEEFWNGFGQRMIAAGDSSEVIARTAWHAAKAPFPVSASVHKAMQRFWEACHHPQLAGLSDSTPTPPIAKVTPPVAAGKPQDEPKRPDVTGFAARPFSYGQQAEAYIDFLEAEINRLKGLPLG